jgi:GAF domain-containing protein
MSYGPLLLTPSSTSDPQAEVAALGGEPRRADAVGLGGIERVLSRVLELAGDALEMDIAWISRIADGAYELRAVEGDSESFGVQVGTSVPFEATYSARTLDGGLPHAVPDTVSDSRTAELEVTSAMDVGAYVGVPLTLSDGSRGARRHQARHLPDSRHRRHGREGSTL